MAGNPEIYVVDANGSHPKRLSLSNPNTANVSPAWNPKTGQSIAYVSDRAGIPKLYLMNSDGTNSVELDLPDKGYLIDPSWSPNGQLLAFSWRRPTGNYDLYIMDVASRQIVEITRDSARNERPVGPPTAGIWCSNPLVAERGRSGPCSRTARRLASSLLRAQ